MKPVDLQPGAVLLLGVLLFVLRPVELAALFLAAAVHELGHFWALRFLGIPVYALSFTVTGPVLHCETASNWYEELLSALAGPAAGLVLWMVSVSRWPLLGEISLYLSLLNLLPILPLDGGRALRAVLASFSDFQTAQTISRIMSLLFCGAMLLAGVYAAASGYGITCAVFAAWMTALACQAHGIVVK